MHQGRRLWYLMLLAVPAALVVQWLNAGPLVQFLAAALGIIPLAAVMGRATESLAARVGPQAGGILSAGFGNAAELILGLVALNRGLIPVVKASITGSIIGNALLVLGVSVLVGGVRNGRQTFDRTAVGLQSTLLVVAAIGLTIPSVLARTLPAHGEVNLSEEVAGVFLATYVLNVVFSVFSHGRKDEDVVGGRKEPAETPPWGPWLAGGILLGATACVAVLSEVLVGAIETARDRGYLEAWGMSEVFVGVVIVAVVGNAAENSTAILMAYRNKIDLSLHIAIGSSLQIALLVMPVLIFASLVLAPEPLDLHFTLLEFLAVGASVLVVHLVAADGQTHWMEGVLLLAVYLILAMAFYHLPGARQEEHLKMGATPPAGGRRRRPPISAGGSAAPAARSGSAGLRGSGMTRASIDRPLRGNAAPPERSACESGASRSEQVGDQHPGPSAVEAVLVAEHLGEQPLLHPGPPEQAREDDQHEDEERRPVGEGHGDGQHAKGEAEIDRVADPGIRAGGDQPGYRTGAGCQAPGGPQRGPGAQDDQRAHNHEGDARQGAQQETRLIEPRDGERAAEKGAHQPDGEERGDQGGPAPPGGRRGRGGGLRFRRRPDPVAEADQRHDVGTEGGERAQGNDGDPHNGSQPRNSSSIGSASASGMGRSSGPGSRVFRSMPRPL
jgi:Ca2+:H+ antiporter